MNNLHRELAPISDAAWSQIEEETRARSSATSPGGASWTCRGRAASALSAVGTGHLRNIAAPGEGIIARQREVKALVELRVPFELGRQQIDDVERGAERLGLAAGEGRRADDWPLPKIAPFSMATPPAASKAFGREPAIR